MSPKTNTAIRYFQIMPMSIRLLLLCSLFLSEFFYIVKRGEDTFKSVALYKYLITISMVVFLTELVIFYSARCSSSADNSIVDNSNRDLCYTYVIKNVSEGSLPYKQ